MNKKPSPWTPYRCPNCGRQWSVPQSDLKFCPYCVSSLDEGEEVVNESDKKQEAPFGIPDLSTLFDRIGQLFEKERVVTTASIKLVKS